MTRKPPVVSIITPSYNQAQFLEEAILSVFNQDYPHVEYIIIDGGSTDGSIDIIRKYESRLKYWVSEPDSGQSEAINKGWNKSTGDIIAWLNSDDTYCRGALRAVAEVFEKNPETLLVHGAANTCAQDGKTVLSMSQPLDMDPYDMIAGCGGVNTQPSIFLRRSVLDEVGYLDPRLHYVMDWEYCIRIGLHYGTRHYQKLDVVLSNNRDWSGNKTNQGWKNLCEEHRSVFARLFAEHPGDEHLQRIRDAAYRSSYRRQADLARRHNERIEALRGLFSAWSIGPLRHNPIRDLYLLFHILIGYENSLRVQHLISPLTRRLNRMAGY